MATLTFRTQWARSVIRPLPLLSLAALPPATRRPRSGRKCRRSGEGTATVRGVFLTPQEITLAAAAIAAAAALLGVYLTARRDDRRVRQERQRQDSLERERWAPEDPAVWGERRVRGPP